MSRPVAPLCARMAFLRDADILVTGGTGFLGRHLLPQLLQAGCRVTCLVRPSSRADLLPAKVATVQADLVSGAGLAEALAGRDVVMHLAGLLFGLSWQEYLRANAAAASALAVAYSRLKNRGVAPRRFVLVSSLAAGGPSAQTPGVNETMPARPVSAYGWSKFMAEHILAAAVGEGLVCLRPPIIYGSGDKALLPVFRGAAKGIAVSPGAFREFALSAVHAQDAAQAVMLCCRPEARGVYYVTDGHEYTMTSFCQGMAKALGRPSLTVVRLPLPVMGCAAVLSSLWGSVCAALRSGRFGQSGQPGRAPEWNMDKFREARQAGWLCDACRIRTELGYTPEMNLEAGMAEAVEGYRREGLL